MAMEPIVLPPKREKFAQHYVTTFNGAKSAEMAGYSTKGSSVQGTRLLADVNVRARIRQLMEWDADRYTEIRSRIINLLIEAATYDPGTNLKSDGSIVDARKIPGALITGSSPKVAGIEIRLFSKEKAAELLMRHLGLLNDRVDVTSAGLPININVRSATDTDAIAAAVSRGH